MPKMKTHKGIKKRFKVSATGKVSHKRCGSSHLNEPQERQARSAGSARSRSSRVGREPPSAPLLARPSATRCVGQAAAMAASAVAAAPEAEAAEVHRGRPVAGRRRPCRLARSETDRDPDDRRPDADLRLHPYRRPIDESATMRAKNGAARNQAKKRLFKAVKGFVGGRRRLLEVGQGDPAPRRHVRLSATAGPRSASSAGSGSPA